MKFVVIGLSITSSWGNGHATTYRGLLKELAKAGHDVLFLEKNVPYYAKNRDLPAPSFCSLKLYASNNELFNLYEQEVATSDVVIVGSYVQNGVEVGEWVTHTARGMTAFYDIDTPVTMAKLQKGDYEYINPELISQYDLYLSFSGGPILSFIEKYYGSPAARALYCSVDPEWYFPENLSQQWEMGYLGTYSSDRQPLVDELLNNTAVAYPRKRFIVVGPQYPSDIHWPSNVERREHMPPSEHRFFYNSQKFTLNVTRDDMKKFGYSPSVRLFEAAACGVPIITDNWAGLTDFFDSQSEILIAETTKDVGHLLKSLSDKERKCIGEKARQAVLKKHTAKIRANELVSYVVEANNLRKKEFVI